ncbi:hypothetical protein EVAR_53183_1 [Eumeta japonica]|uniref:Uncharacterized protein n=1 Tax=Eumeta variegata TaxID=151549 RepID=A0A4C1YYM3_EUMVA|nr:hypothetical protein EVAR_53183_1 [Eumeta japonica]
MSSLMIEQESQGKCTGKRGARVRAVGRGRAPAADWDLEYRRIIHYSHLRLQFARRLRKDYSVVGGAYGVFLKYRRVEQWCQRAVSFEIICSG